jgi:hypothetical protein
MQAQVEDTREYTLNVRRFATWQIARFALVIGFVAILMLSAQNGLGRTLSNCLVAVLYPALLFSGAFSILWTFPTWASRIRCDPTGIEVKYVLRPSPRQWAWDEIEELSMLWPAASGRVYVIRSKKNSLKVSIENFSQEATLIKTILERASLHFVEGSIGAVSYTYKRFDAE